MPEKLDLILGLYGGTLEDNDRQRLLEELRDPQSEAAQIVDAVRVLARLKVDVHKIPGLQELAALEDRLLSLGRNEGEHASQ
jgi:hypothetical protein